MKVEFYRHNLGEKERKDLSECLDGIFLTTGEWVSRFEGKFAQYLSLPYAIGLNSCTAALHLSLLALGIKEGDEVITSPLTFIATANAILYTGATPVFVDVEAQTGLIDVDLIAKKITTKTKAIIPIHLYGQMCDMVKLRELADRHNLKIVEDAAHCIEGKRDGHGPGFWGDIACFSFYATKNITSGEGGAIATRHKEYADKIKCLRSHGMSVQAADRYVGKYRHWDMECLGWKYNMTNIDASLLLNQIDEVDNYRVRREEIASKYKEAFASCPSITILKSYPNITHAHHLFTILVPPDRRDEILWKLNEKNIGVAVNYRAIHLLSFYQKNFQFKKGMFPQAERIGESTLTLPLYPKLTQEQIDYVIESVREVV